MEKKVLVMCTENSCRSIFGEALVNKYLDGIKAYSCGTIPDSKINPNAKKVLKKNGIWNENFHSKNLDEVIDIPFDLIVTVCDHAKEICPIFPKTIKKIHIGFIYPNGKDFDEFIKTYKEMEKILLPKVIENI